MITNIFGQLFYWMKLLMRRITGNYNITIPVPTTRRTDLLVGYYSTNDEQPAQVVDHVNLNWESQFQGVAGIIRHMMIMKCATIIDIAYQIYDTQVVDGVRTTTMRDDDTVRANIRALFTELKDNGLLGYVVGLVTCDEPNNQPTLYNTFGRAIAMTKQVAREFEELKNVKMVVIYAAGKPYVGIEMYDWVGFDDYDKKTTVLEEGFGAYGQLRKQLRSDQRVILVPGATFGQEPGPFVNFAHAHPEVVAIVAFLWHSVSNADESFTGVVGGDGALRGKYIIAYKEAIGKYVQSL